MYKKNIYICAAGKQTDGGFKYEIVINSPISLIVFKGKFDQKINLLFTLKLKQEKKTHQKKPRRVSHAIDICVMCHYIYIYIYVLYTQIWNCERKIRRGIIFTGSSL